MMRSDGSRYWNSTDSRPTSTPPVILSLAMTALADANTYVDSRFGPNYTSWLGLEPEDQQRTLNSAVGYIDSLAWQGTATGAANDLGFTSWPRSGIDGVSDATIPQQLLNATYELAILISTDPDLPNKLDQGSNISSVQGGGGVGVSYFRPTSAANGTATLLPVLVQRMIGQWLAGATGVAGAVITGINARSDFGTRCGVCSMGLTGSTGCTCGGRRDVAWPV